MKILIIERNIKKTLLSVYGVDNPSKSNVLKEKRKQTMIERYGVEYYVLNKDFKEKSEKTSLKNYGVPHPQMSKEMLKRRYKYYEKMGYNITSDDWNLYKNKVYYLTKKIKKDLLKKWDGKDYYDGEFIKDNFNLPYYHGNYPTIDHKITIFEGFKNGISSEKIADFSNLCFTKRRINSKKYTLPSNKFIL